MKVGLQIQTIQSEIKEKSSGSIAGIRKIADAVVSLIVMKICHDVIFSLDIYYIKRVLLFNPQNQVLFRFKLQI